jgi:hypothetical protein
MRAYLVVKSYLLVEQMPQMLLAEDPEVIQTLGLDRQDPPLRMAVEIQGCIGHC